MHRQHQQLTRLLKQPKQQTTRYNSNIKKTISKIKTLSKKLILKNFCHCIKKLEPKFKGAAIPICTKSVLFSRGLTRGKFKCRGHSAFIKTHKI